MQQTQPSAIGHRQGDLLAVGQDRAGKRWVGGEQPQRHVLPAGEGERLLEQPRRLCALGDRGFNQPCLRRPHERSSRSTSQPLFC